MRKRTATSVITVVVVALATVRVDGHVKDAIQDLYAEIRMSEMAANRGGRSHAVHLDEATSNKAKYVSECLQRLIGGSPRGNEASSIGARKTCASEAATRVDHATYDDSDDGDSGVRVDRLMHKLAEVSLAKSRKNSKARTKASGPTPSSLMDVESLERRFRDLLEQFVQRPPTTASTPAAVTTARVYRRNKAPPPPAQHRTGGTVLGGLFKFPVFNKQ